MSFGISRPLPVACANCRFWQSLEDVRTDSSGKCRRRPPVILAEYGNTWPETFRSDWCGEFEERGR